MLLPRMLLPRMLLPRMLLPRMLLPGMFWPTAHLGTNAKWSNCNICLTFIPTILATQIVAKKFFSLKALFLRSVYLHFCECVSTYVGILKLNSDHFTIMTIMCKETQFSRVPFELLTCTFRSKSHNLQSLMLCKISPSTSLYNIVEHFIWLDTGISATRWETKM